MNALACLGSVLVSNLQKFEHMKSMKIKDIYDQILVMKDDNVEYPLKIEKDSHY